MRKQEHIMKIERTYEKDGIKITRYAAKKVRTKQVIKGKQKITAQWSEPTKKNGVSSIYRNASPVTPITAQTGRSTDKGSENRSWQQDA